MYSKKGGWWVEESLKCEAVSSNPSTTKKKKKVKDRHGGTCQQSQHLGGRGRRVPSLRSVWGTFQVPDQPGLHSETLSQILKSQIFVKRIIFSQEI
jgi:hypothetical protein